ncbi:MAG: DNA polymerase IV [Cyclobacteriaceae bacterium]|nr:DNA polymerase IV [Cyclobacteriaceae bacterium HetDA_MAG_MS6]
MDAFYASVEQRDNPTLRGKPVAVGGNAARGVVAAASYEARKFGVRSAMPSITAAKRCPDLVFVRPDFEKYKAVSNQIRSIFLEYTDLVEPLSLDEAYLDVTKARKGPQSATLIAHAIKDAIKKTTELTASAGISYNKFLAKIASDMDKPDGLFVILPEEADEFVAKLPIKKFFGIGAVTAEKMKHAGIFTGADLRKHSLEDLTLRYGKSGTYYYNIARGVDDRSVKPDRERKSISVENTFDTDLTTMSEVKTALLKLTQELFRRYEKYPDRGKTMTVKIKYADFRQITRSKTKSQDIVTIDQLQKLIEEVLSEQLVVEIGIRLLGVGISNFEKPEVTPAQLTIEF